MHAVNEEKTLKPISIVAFDAASAEKGLGTSLRGALLALDNNPSLQILCVGKEEDLKKSLDEIVQKNPGLEHSVKRLELVNANECVGMDEKTSFKMIQNKETSIYKCVGLVVDGKADALVSPGNTGATITSLKRGAITWRHPSSLKDLLIKPGLLARFPNYTENELSYLCDAGALINVDSTTLSHFGLMMRVYLEKVEKKNQPRIALLNIGTEKGKGDLLYNEAYDLLEKYSEKGLVNFVGNKEPRDVINHTADGFVCSAQIGNIFAKTAEAASEYVKRQIKENYESQKFPVKVLGGLSLSSIKNHLREKIDLIKLGGGLLLGTRYNAVIAHGRADERELAGAILYAARIKDFELKDEITNLLKETRWYSRIRT